MTAMSVEYDDETFEFDLDNLTVQQARTWKTVFDVTMGTIGEKLDEADPDGLSALYWLMMVQNGKPVPVDQIDFPIGPFVKAIGEGFARQAEAEKAAAKKAGGRPKAVAK